MNAPARIKTLADAPRLSDRAFAATAAALAFLAYFAVFMLIGDGPLSALASSARNMAPLAIVSAAAHWVVARHLVGASLARQVGGHILLAASFSLVLYWLLMVAIGVATGASATKFEVRDFFPTRAIVWQLLQGVTLYALVACLTYLRARPPSLGLELSAEPAPATASREQGPSRYFIKQGEDIHPMEVSQIVSIKGADDYAEVATMQGRHLVRMTLAEFEKTLEGENFIRAHRSHIVNVDRIARAEPAGGGRMLLHMENGEMISASRAGSRLLRDRVI
jgi:DNA-binding LytR/AlgR family response regulator